MLDIKNISFSYDKKPTLKHVSFKIEKGQNMALIGESGCGKSTLLKLLYGMYDLDSGTINFKDKPILGPKFNLIPGEDNIKYLAQDFDLMPYITVAENIGKFLSSTNKTKKQTRIQELLEMVEMVEFSSVKAQFLSGGQMQRVAIARVLALEPELLLLDEPFSHIDNFRRNNLSRKLFAYLKKQQITCIVATHDGADVLSFADEVAVMKDGIIVESGVPQKIHSNPKNKYVASLFGDVNEIKGKYLGIKSEPEKTLFIYPYQLKAAANSNLEVTTKHSYFRGSHYLIEAVYEDGVLFFESKTAILENTLVYLK